MNVRGDFLVIGSGIAGLRAAVSLAEAGDVIVLTKADPAESNTGYAQGGIAAAMGPDDSPVLHARDDSGRCSTRCLVRPFLLAHLTTILPQRKGYRQRRRKVLPRSLLHLVPK